MMATAIATVGITNRHAEEQHLAERDTQQTGQRQRTDTGNGENDPAFQADRHCCRHACGPVLADLLRKTAGEGCRDDKQHIEKDRLEQGRYRQRHRVGHPLGSEQLQQRLNQALDGPGLLQDRAHQDAERNQQAHLGHDVAEPLGDRLDRFLDSEADRQSEVGGSDHQRHDRIQLEPHDHHDHRDDRDRGVDDDCGV